MKPKIILRSDALPEHLQKEIGALQKALFTKYGAAACIAGTTLENLTQVCSMIRADLTETQKIDAYNRAREVCADVMKLLGRLLHVEPDEAIAVADSFREFTSRIEEELLGAEILQGTASAAQEAIAKAARH